MSGLNLPNAVIALFWIALKGTIIRIRRGVGVLNQNKTECLQKKLSSIFDKYLVWDVQGFNDEFEKETLEAVRDIASSIEKRIDTLFQERDRLSTTWLHKRAVFNAKILELEWTHTLITGKIYRGSLVGSSPSTSKEAKK